ncbi:AraC family transcriptional regulator ligand-binding domain-containing protein [Aquabacterium sp.]|uniref:AraC family transcriptional regulator n=1 Tax=Aquabacterium sp. TaxID=1872578 RepID=UPI003D6CB95E
MDYRLQSLPSVLPQTYLELVSELGFSPREVLRKAQLTTRDVNSANGLGPAQYERLLLAVRDTVGDIGIGMEMGWRLPPTAFGALGTAILSSATLRDALALTEKYWPIYGIGLTFAVRQEPGLRALEFNTLPVLVPPAVRPMVLETVVTSMYRSTLALVGLTALPCQVWFDFEEPPYAHEVRRRLGDVRYGMPATQLRLDASRLDQPLPMANPVSLRQAMAQCEDEMARQSQASAGLANLVQQLLALGDGGYPNLESVAQTLSLSSRTLRRRLNDEGVSYLELLNLARARDAKTLLMQPHLEVQHIAERLGYRHAANFARAFKAWVGEAPGAYRLRSSHATLP